MMAQLTLDGDDELRDDGEDLGVSACQKVKDSLNSKESVWVLLLADTLHEDWEIVMIIKLVHLNFPLNLVRLTVLNLNREVSTVIETTELTRRNSSEILSASSRSNNSWPFCGSIQGARIATRSLSFL